MEGDTNERTGRPTYEGYAYIRRGGQWDCEISRVPGCLDSRLIDSG
jgi:hypothetical protein